MGTVNYLANGFMKPLSKAWTDYKRYAETAVGFENRSVLRDLVFWRKKLLSVFTIYFVPISFMALIPGVWMSVHAHLWVLAAVDSGSVFLITVIMFSSSLSQWTKNACIISILYLLALILILSLGLFGPGVLYLYGITVFMSIMFDKKYAYCSVVAHFFTCGLFAEMASRPGRYLGCVFVQSDLFKPDNRNAG